MLQIAASKQPIFQLEENTTGATLYIDGLQYVS